MALGLVCSRESAWFMSLDSDPAEMRSMEQQSFFHSMSVFLVFM